MIDASRLVFTPIEASNATEAYVDWRQENQGGGMPLYIPSLEFKPGRNEGFLPVLPGELISVIGRPGNGKTGFMLRWARERAKWLREQAAAGNETAKNSVSVYVTIEQTVEELRLFHVAAEDRISVSTIANGQLEKTQWDNIKGGLKRLHPVPLWYIGRSMKRRRDKIETSAGNIFAALESIEKWQGDKLEQSVDSIFIDYLQKFRPTKDDGNDFVQFYGGVTNYIKDWAGHLMARTVLGVQAKREVDQRQIPIPLMDDGQWSSTIEQFSDGIISVVRPSHYKQDGEEFAGVTVKGKNQMLVSFLKRKLGPENFNGWVNFQPEYNQLDELELKRYDLNKDA